MGDKKKGDEKPKVKKKLDIKTLHKDLFVDTKFLDKLSAKRKECVLAIKSKKDAEDIKEKEKKDKEEKEKINESKK